MKLHCTVRRSDVYTDSSCLLFSIEELRENTSKETLRVDPHIVHRFFTRSYRGFILFSDRCSNSLKKKFFDDQRLSYNSILWCFDGKRNSKISIDFSRDFQKIVRILPSRNWLDGIIIDRRPFFPSKTSHRERKTRSITLRFDLYPSSI